MVLLVDFVESSSNTDEVDKQFPHEQNHKEDHICIVEFRALRVTSSLFYFAHHSCQNENIDCNVRENSDKVHSGCILDDISLSLASVPKHQKCKSQVEESHDDQSHLLAQDDFKDTISI